MGRGVYEILYSFENLSKIMSVYESDECYVGRALCVRVLRGSETDQCLSIVSFMSLLRRPASSFSGAIAKSCSHMRHDLAQSVYHPTPPTSSSHQHKNTHTAFTHLNLPNQSSHPNPSTIFTHHSRHPIRPIHAITCMLLLPPIPRLKKLR